MGMPVVYIHMIIQPRALRYEYCLVFVLTFVYMRNAIVGETEMRLQIEKLTSVHEVQSNKRMFCHQKDPVRDFITLFITFLFDGCKYFAANFKSF